ncbi:MAG: oxidoreductase [Paenibacillaceae bacterium]|jgi:EmrB/QacA subfamily drug resistance transporter|nr:oxidoreductase [Paenibacillaceae bacterium]
MNKPQMMKREHVLAGLLLATFLAAIEGTVIGPAGPTIVGELGNVSLLSWIFTAYLLTMAVTTPIFGKLSDLFGRKPVFMAGCALFALGSLLCMFANSMSSLIIYRAIQGMGAGSVIPITFTIIGDIYKLEERGKIQGLISSVWGVSSLVGPLLGGYVVSYLGWEWIFGFNVPLTLLAMFFIYRYLEENIAKRKARIDIPGAVTFTLGMTALLLALTLGGQTLAWSSPGLLLLAACAVIMLGLFLWIEKRAAEPIVPLYLFRIRDLTVSYIAALLISSLVIGLTSFLPLWIQGVRGGDAASSGLALLPMSIGWFTSSIIGGRLMFTIGSRLSTMIGLSFIVLGGMGMAFLSNASPSWYLPLCTSLYGLGFGFCITVFTILAQSSVGFELRGASTALSTFLRTLGQTIGAAAFGSWLNHRIASGARESDLFSQGVTQSHINSLLAPHGQQIDSQIALLLRDLLDNSVHSLFILMAGIAVISWFAGLGLRKHQAAGQPESLVPNREGA